MATIETLSKNRLSTGPTNHLPRKPARRSSGLIWLFIIVGAVGATAYFGRGVLIGMFTDDSATATQFQTYTVQRNLLRITVTEDGNVESADNVDLKCQIEGGSTILWITDEGEMVEKGAKLVEFDAAAVEELITQQTITRAEADAAFKKAEADLLVAEIGIEEYTEGTFQQELKKAESNIVIAELAVKQAQNILDYTQNMFRKGLKTQLEKQASEDSLKRAELDLDVYTSERGNMIKYTKRKMVTELVSTRDAAEKAAEAKRQAYELEKTKLVRLQQQLKNCVITAPQAGMVLYANDRSRRSRSEASMIEEGSMVRERQSVIKLPDLENMQVRVVVHETKIDKIVPGMHADITVRDVKLVGEVLSVASQPEPGSWMQNDVKEYAVVVSVGGEIKGLGIKPGMTSEVDILIDEIADAITVPLLGIVEQGDKYYCYLAGGTEPKKREVVIGESNDKYIEIKDGLKEGEVVILNPRATIPDAQRIVERPDDDDGRAKGAGSKGKGAIKKKAAGKSKKKPSGKKGSAKKKKGGFDLMSNDKDGDGKVSKEEAPERMKQFFDAMDSNKDGFITRGEAAAARRRMQERMKKSGGGGFRGPPR